MHQPPDGGRPEGFAQEVSGIEMLVQTDSARVEQAREQFLNLGGALKTFFQERDEHIEAALAALVAREHVLIIGPPGTAKSFLAREVCRRIQGAVYFQWLLTRFSTPEELFGPISLRSLEEGRYERVTTGKLPHAHIGFIDEIFKASPAILNTLLSLMNERIFYNDGKVETVPVVTLFGASNDLPDEDELEAFDDRFLVRMVVEPIREYSAFARMLAAPEEPEATNRVDLADLLLLQEAALLVNLGPEILETLVEIRGKLGEEGIRLSDRRYKHSLRFLRAHALLQGRTSAERTDLLALRHTLWLDVEQRNTVASILAKATSTPVAQAEELSRVGHSVYAEAIHLNTSEAILEADHKLRQVVSRLEQLKQRSNIDEKRSILKIAERMEDLRRNLSGLS